MRPFLRSAISSLFLLAASSAEAAVFEEVELPPNSRIALFVGTFDPFHSTHRAIAEKSLAAGVDFVVVLANDLTVHKPLATPYADRLRMLQAEFKNSKKILVPRLNLEGLGPVSNRAISQIRIRCPSCTVLAVKGTDVATNPLMRYLDHVFFPGVRDWIISERDPEVAVALRRQLDPESRYVFLEEEKGNSSTSIRKWFAEHPDFYSGKTAGPDAISAEVLGIIRKDRWYDPRVKRIPLLTRSRCATLLVGITTATGTLVADQVLETFFPD